MSEAVIVDARGLSCPEPVLMTRNALHTSGKKALTVLVSSATARDNVLRLLDGAGRKAAVKEDGDEWKIEAAAE